MSGQTTENIVNCTFSLISGIMQTETLSIVFLNLRLFGVTAKICFPFLSRAIDFLNLANQKYEEISMKYEKNVQESLTKKNKDLLSDSLKTRNISF